METIEKYIKIYDKFNINYKCDLETQINIVNSLLDYIFGSVKGGSGERVLDYIKDFSFIQASFMQLYNINLRSENLTWWEFKSYLDGCFESIDNPIKKIVGYRATKLPNIDKYNKDHVRYLRDKKNQYRLEQKLNNNSLGQMFRQMKALAKKVGD